ncbi:DoxX family protein [Botrimarina hoheduenensis]|uniref:DoxX n=1 Tax=Botrimarina hoheduenensis TaxID=2528000 RepID=A0A5C5VZN7_9BACT|nr:DoxX family protein [Botrimarina hoheduenensis]TWT42952.1 DoxX [Botrimarina hoheduenensis]
MHSSASTYTLPVICLLVALRLATGWHFFNEGVKKLDPGFSSAGFLSGAVGPLAPLFKAMNPGPYGANKLLSQPAEFADSEELSRWQADYAKRAGAALKKNQPLPTDYAPEAPYAPLLDAVRDGWQSNRERLARVPGVSEEAVKRSAEIAEEHLSNLAYYFFTESEAIAENQHEAWRLSQMKAEQREGPSAPYLSEQIDKKEAQINKAVQTWARELNKAETGYLDDVVAAIASDNAGPSPTRVRSALAERSPLEWIDFTVTWVVLGAGVLLFFGLLTPFGALMAAGFLLSVMATQPPWDPAADTTYFFYQLVEVIALVILAVVGAGRWAGLDGIYDRACGRLPAPVN